MRIREYNSSDLNALRAMHEAQGFGYPLPDLESPLFLSKLVLEDDDLEDAKRDEDVERRDVERTDGKLNFNERNRKLRYDTLNDAELSNGKNVQQFTGVAPNDGSRANISRREGREARTVSSPRVAMAILTRLTAETYLLHDPAAGSPRLRWKRFLALHDAARHAAASCGLDDVQAFLPPRVARAFGRRLERLGWTRDPWPCFSRRVP